MAATTEEPGKIHEPVNPVEDAAWVYRGYHLKTSDFVSSMVH